jgi:hypothetical protein
MKISDKVIATESGTFGGITGEVISVYPAGTHGTEPVLQVLFRIQKHFYKAQFPKTKLRYEHEAIDNFIMF